MEQPQRKNRTYTETDLKNAVENIMSTNMTLYRAAKEFKIPWSTLKDNVDRLKTLRENDENAQLTMSKIGRPFSLSVELEQKLFNYIIQMQEIGFGLTVTKIKEMALSLAKAANKEHSFNEEKGSAGWNWWVKYKERYGLSLRTPENLSAGRAICSNPVVLQDFYDKLEKVSSGIDPSQIWNCDETGLMFVNKPSKIVTSVGKKYVYNRTFAEKGTTTTLLGCINAAGCHTPPFIIFKGVRNISELKNGFMPNTEVRFSPKGWINGELFLDWIQFFVKCIPPARPVLLVMDSHASHVNPAVLEYARSQQIILFTIPAHTSQLLQPLDVSIHRPLKSAWRSEIEAYKRKHPCSIPTRYDFYKFFTPTFEKTFTPSNIRAGFRKSGIYPFSRTAVEQEAFAPSKLTEKPLPQETESTTFEIVENTEPNNTPRIRIIEDVWICPAMSENTSGLAQGAPCDPLRSDDLLTRGVMTESVSQRVTPALDSADSLSIVDIPSELVMDTDYDQITNMDDLPPIQSLVDDESIIYTVVGEITKTQSSENINKIGSSALRKIRIPNRAPHTFQTIETIFRPTTPHETNTTIKKIYPSPNNAEEIKHKVSKISPSSSTIASDINEAVDKILELPKWDPSHPKKRCKRTVPRARCLTPLKPLQENIPSTSLSISKQASERKPFEKNLPSTSIASKRNVGHDIQSNKTSTSRATKLNPRNLKSSTAPNSTKPKAKFKKKRTIKDDDDWSCDTCKGLYSEDATSKNGAEWISCSFCLKTYHTHCQSQELEATQSVFMCDMCCADEDED